MENVLRVTTFIVFFSVQNYLVIMKKVQCYGGFCFESKLGCGTWWKPYSGLIQCVAGFCFLCQTLANVADE